MDSFEDIDQFAADAEGPSLELEPEGIELGAPVRPAPAPEAVAAETAGDDDGFEFASADDDFQEVRISKPPSKRGPLPSPETEEPRAEPMLEIDPDAIAEAPMDAEASSDDADEAWSHQNLSRFKLDIASLEGDDVKLDLEEAPAPESLEHGDFLHHQEEAPAPRAAARGGLKLTNFADEAYHLPADSESAPAGGLAGRLSADRLEEIVRAQVREQSREIIETVVRRIVRDVVPDLATKIIREELHRLLEDSARGESSP